jgi:hypothetical protein
VKDHRLWTLNIYGQLNTSTSTGYHHNPWTGSTRNMLLVVNVYACRRPVTQWPLLWDWFSTWMGVLFDQVKWENKASEMWCLAGEEVQSYPEVPTQNLHRVTMENHKFNTIRTATLPAICATSGIWTDCFALKPLCKMWCEHISEVGPL